MNFDAHFLGIKFHCLGPAKSLSNDLQLGLQAKQANQ